MSIARKLRYTLLEPYCVGKRFAVTSGHESENYDPLRGEGSFAAGIAYGPGGELFNPEPPLYWHAGTVMPRYMSIEVHAHIWRRWWVLAIRCGLEPTVVDEPIAETEAQS
ncbi:hypothetical protein [Gordonia phage Tarzan]|uniref:Uncharacterized protein n=1 Tax=Gordonia phage Tarzan TaxID=3038367 RepID=A0AAF0GGY5_9CAUD|nr:hypothetical protein QLQ76_gp48 [Gordonia phage Tarzan]WGH20082.1 hypothetical protein [Gordonia phage Tarzan]